MVSPSSNTSTFTDAFAAEQRTVYSGRHLVFKTYAAHIGFSEGHIYIMRGNRLGMLSPEKT